MIKFFSRLISLEVVAIGLAVATSGAAKTQPHPDNRYEIVNQAIAPIIAALTREGSNGDHAFNIEATVADAGGLPPQLKGAHLRVAYEFPDKLLVQFPLPDGTVTICRNGQSVWAYPRAVFLPLVEHLGAPISTQPLPPLEIDRTKAIFLPALLDVRDGGNVAFAGQTYRMLDLRPIAVTKKQLAANQWPGRIWINPSDHRIAQLAIQFAGWNVTLAIDKVELAPAFPPETWNPTTEQHDQVTAVPGDKLFTLIDLVLKQINHAAR
ncbi:MAG: hypothetical protein ACJ8KU_00140 [Chthoniobacterales bacterium]